MGLKYRPDWHAARERLTHWWHGGDLGRPVMLLHVPRETPWEALPELPAPPGWTGGYSTASLTYRIHQSLRACLRTEYLGEAVPNVPSGDVGAGSLALYLGCRGVEKPDTVWIRPIEAPDGVDQVAYDPANFYWQFSLAAYRAVSEQAGDKLLQQFPDLVEGLDTLASLRGTAELLCDLLDRPAWVHDRLARLTQLYFDHYDRLYDLVRDEVGGSVYWVWAPGRLAKLQCDFSCMISPGQFREFMLPVLSDMTERLSYSLYHLDGVDAMRHVPALCEVPRLQMIQWTPGAGQPDPHDERWWPMYHQILEAGKKLYLYGVPPERFAAFRREFGAGCGQMLFTLWLRTREEAEGCLRAFG